MFGDLGGMMQKLKDAKIKVEETKKRLDTVIVEGTANNGAIRVEVTANKAVKNIEIDNSLMNDKEQLEDYLILALNDALTKAIKVNEAEMAAAAKDGLPNLPGFDLFK